MLCAVLILAIMKGSGYTIPGSGYAQLFEILIETVLFCGVVGTYLASAVEESNTLLLVTAGAVLFCGVYFFGANALARTKVRNVLIGKKDAGSYFKGNPFYNQTTPTGTAASSMSSKNTNMTFLMKPGGGRGGTGRGGGGQRGGGRGGGLTRPSRNNNVGGPAEFTMDYINDHLHHQYRYPLNMWDQVKDGKRVRRPKKPPSDYALGEQGSSEV